MTIITDLDFFETVYLITDPSQEARIITGIDVSPAENGNYCLVYQVSVGAYASKHYRRELSLKKDERKILFT